MDFVTETQIKAIRKERPCGVCGTALETGSPAVSWAGRVDGDFHSNTFHLDCRAAEVEFNKETLSGEWYELRYDHCREDRAWLLDKYPEVARRLGILADAA